MSKFNAISKLVLLAAFVSAAFGLMWLLSAQTTAHLRFGECGPSTLEHADSYCRVASRLLYRSFGTLALAAVLLGVGLYLRRRGRHAA
jgi:hypothetical protein